MWELDHKESWVPKNWCFWTVGLEKTLESPLDCKEIQSILKQISPKYSLEGLMLKLKLQYFGHLMQRTDSLEKTLMLGKIEGRRRRGWQRMGWLDGITDSMDVSLSKLWRWWWTGKPGVLQSTGSQRAGHHWVTELNCLMWMIKLQLGFAPWVHSWQGVRGPWSVKGEGDEYITVGSVWGGPSWPHPGPWATGVPEGRWAVNPEVRIVLLKDDTTGVLMGKPVWRLGKRWRKWIAFSRHIWFSLFGFLIEA